MAEGRNRHAHEALVQLQELFPDEVFVPLALPREEDAVLLRDVGELVAAGDLETATERLALRVQAGGRTSAVVAAEESVAALLALRDYLAAQPYPSARAMATALGRLSSDGAVRILSSSPRFQAWFAEQEEVLRVRQRREEEERLLELTHEFSAAVSGGNAAARELTLSRIRELDPRHPACRVQDERGRGLDLAAVADAARQTPWGRSGLAPALLQVWPELTPAQKRLGVKLAAGMADTEPTVATDLLAALAAADRDTPAQALAALQRACRRGPVASEYLVTLIPQILLPREQFLARPWRTPFPTAVDAVSALVQIADHRLRKESHP
jgi:hypothetical protein